MEHRGGGEIIPLSDYICITHTINHDRTQDNNYYYCKLDQQGVSYYDLFRNYHFEPSNTKRYSSILYLKKDICIELNDDLYLVWLKNGNVCGWDPRVNDNYDIPEKDILNYDLSVVEDELKSSGCAPYVRHLIDKPTISTCVERLSTLPQDSILRKVLLPFVEERLHVEGIYNDIIEVFSVKDVYSLNFVIS